MAKQVITKLVDDIDGSTADETVEFALDGQGYSIDLSAANGLELRAALEKYIEAGTRLGKVPGMAHAQLQRHRPTVSAVQTRADREENQRIREWANANGYEVAERGRIPAEIVEAYYAATTVRATKVGGAKKVAFKAG